MEVLAFFCVYILGLMTTSLYRMSRELDEYQEEEPRVKGDFKIFDLRRPQ